MRSFASVPIAALVLLASARARGAADAAAIIARSMEANRADWAAAPNFDYVERSRDDSGVRTFAVTMILGTPYKRLLMVNGRRLSPSEERAQQDALEAERTKRERETPDERAKRLAEFQRKRERAHRILDEMPKAFEYRLMGTRRAGPGTVYVVAAAPREGYEPPDVEGRVLTAMRGEFWVDTRTYQWVKGTVRVLRPVSVEGFLAKVQPGTEIEIEQMPVEDGVWLPRHFEIRSRSSILLLFHHRTYEDDTYLDYRRTRSR